MSGQGGKSAAPAGSPMGQLPLETERLILRPYGQDDAPAIAALLNDPVMAEFLMVIPHPFVDFDARQLVKAAWRRLTTGRGFDLLVVAKDGGAPVGSAGVGLHDERARGELGFWVGRAHWGQGYATEAAGRILAFAQDTLAVSRFTATATVDNAASRRVLEKLGFVETGRTEKQMASTGEMRAAILFELTGEK